MVDENNRRLSINLRIDPQKFQLLESMRKTGFGLAQTERNRADIYNEIIGYGLQLQMRKQEIGDRDFENVWKFLHDVNWKMVEMQEEFSLAEVVVFGTKMCILKKELGEKDFGLLMGLLENVNWKKVNLEKIRQLVS